MAKHFLFENNWFVCEEFDATDDECAERIEKRNPKEFKIIKGNWCELQYEVMVEDKEEIFNKHTQGSVFNEKQDNEGAI